MILSAPLIVAVVPTDQYRPKIKELIKIMAIIWSILIAKFFDKKLKNKPPEPQQQIAET
ncbi:hypothetical protein [Mycoplasmopsis synoviae]|uniref:hypothetical protein n=1 Tax=Mycoplasmopsis synoviae TaxID=2109 RepID=UPI003563CADC